MDTENQCLNIVIVEDEESHFQLMKRAVEREMPSTSIRHFPEAGLCLEALDGIDPDIIVTDYMMPGMSGIEFLEVLNRRGKDVPVIITTGQGDERVAVQAMKLGARDYLVKTAEFFKLLPTTIKKVMHERRLKASLRGSAHLNKLLLDSLPHPAMLLRRDRSILAANKVAQEMGANVGGLCWRDFAHCDYIPEEDRQYIREQGSPRPGGTKCTFCLADESFASRQPASAPEVSLFGRIWDISWIPIDRETCLHYAIDITELKQRERELREERDFAGSLIETAQTIILVLDTNGRILRFNRYMEQISGYSLEEVKGRDWFETFLPERDLKRVRRLFRKSIDNILTRGNVNPIVTRDGKELCIEWSGTTIRDAGGAAIGVLCTGQDITERLMAQVALSESEKKYRRIVETAHEGIWLLDADVRTVFVNRQTARMLGCTPDEMVGKTPFEFMDGRLLQELESYSRLCREGTSEQYEFRFRRKDGSDLWVIVGTTPFTDDKGKFAGSLGMLTDITLRKQAEMALRESEEKFRSLAESSTDCIMRYDRACRHTYVNPACAQIAGIAVEEFIGKTHKQMGSFDVDQCEVWEEKIGKVFETGEPQGWEFKFEGSSGPVYLDWRLVPEFKDGDVKAVLGMSRDITERMLSEQYLRQSQKELRFLSSKLLSAHEEERKRIAAEIHDSIGSSLTALKICLENVRKQLEQGETGPEITDMPISWTQHAIDEARRLMGDLRPSMIDDLGLIPTVNWFCRQFTRIYPDIDVEKDVAITEDEIPKELRIVIFRIIQESLNNIGKYSGAESVCLSISKDASFLRLVVADDGKGFDLAGGLSKENGRRGLGLTSMRERAELSGGSLSIFSSPGHGTTVRASWHIRAQQALVAR